MDRLDFFVLGATGNVGSEFIRKVTQDDMTTGLHNNPRRIVGVASSETYLFEREGINPKNAIAFSKKESKGRSYDSLSELSDVISNETLPTALAPHFARMGDDRTNRQLVILDLTGLKGEEILNFHKDVALGTNPNYMVTANKNPLVEADIDTFRELTSNVSRYGYSSSVMAGAGLMPFMKKRLDLEDHVESIEGCFSGTLGFICSLLDKGVKVSEAVKLAKEGGYTEPHPRDDLSGFDVARKLVILARTSGYNVRLGNVNIDPFLDDKYMAQNDITTFMDDIRDADEEMVKRVITAGNRGNVLRYVAKMDVPDLSAGFTKAKPELSVGLREVSKESSIGSLEGTANLIVVNTNVYSGKNGPYTLGPVAGAGRDVTALNVLDDAIDLISNRKISYR